ncbi:MAG: hypothetical protein J7M25_06040 [Deltaproteobacteria bacterium]|nr:hypothetical protein [Deltaproteobacteria bacterium]
MTRRFRQATEVGIGAMKEVAVLFSVAGMVFAGTGCGHKSRVEKSGASKQAKTSARPAGMSSPKPNLPRMPKKVPTAGGTAAAEPGLTAPVTWDFEKAALGALPKGFLVTSGKWAVVADRTAPSGPKVLAQQGVGPDSRYNVVLSTSPVTGDVDLSVKLKTVKGRIDQGGGVAWRAKDGKNYYVVRYNPLEDNFRVYHVKGGVRTMLGSARTKRPHKGWHQVRAVMTGAHIQCYLDGKKLLDLFDKTFMAPGKVGLWTKSDARTNFDHFMASPVDAKTAPSGSLSAAQAGARGGAMPAARSTARGGARPAARSAARSGVRSGARGASRPRSPVRH